MLQHADKSANPETLELALEWYNELLDLLDFMVFNIPGVFVRRADCLIKLVGILRDDDTLNLY